MNRHSLRTTTLAVALLSIGAAGVANGQSTTGLPATQMGSANPAAPATRQPASSLSASDRQFLENAAEANLGEIEAGKLAKEKAKTDPAKQFAGRMVHDHTQVGDRLRELAAAKGVTLPTSLDQADRKELEVLQNLSGAKFDDAYMQHQVSDHRKVIRAFEEEARSAKDPDVRAFASQTLPTLQDHLRIAQADREAEVATGTPKQQAGLASAKNATGATSVAAEKQERMPVEKTGM